MWECDHCGEEHEDSFDSCWNCGYSKEGESPTDDLGRQRELKSVDASDGAVSVPVELFSRSVQDQEP